MNWMIERVAKAIAKAYKESTNSWQTFDNWQQFVPEARAAIIAMCETRDRSLHVSEIDDQLLAEIEASEYGVISDEEQQNTPLSVNMDIDLLQPLIYARRFLKTSEHDTEYVDAAIEKALRVTGGRNETDGKN